MPSPAPVCPEPEAPTERSLRLHGSRGKADRGRAKHRATITEEEEASGTSRARDAGAVARSRRP